MVRPADDVLYETDRFVVGVFKNIVVTIWGVQGTVALVSKVDEVSENVRKAHPEGFSAVHVVLGNAPLPDGLARNKFREVTQRHADDIACVGAVLEGTGFWVSALQSFITSLHWVTARPFKLKTFSTIREVAKWLPPLHTERTGVAIDSLELELSLTSFRARVG